VEETESGLRLTLVCAEPVFNGEASGIDLRICLELKTGGKALLMKVLLDNRGRYEIRDLGLGCSGIGAPDENSFLALPSIYFGTLWRNPVGNMKRQTILWGGARQRADILASILQTDGLADTIPKDALQRLLNYQDASSVVLAYPGQSEDGMLGGWADYYGPGGGLGVGYLNRREYAMKLVVGAPGDSLSLRWHHFDLQGTMMGGRYPLEPGASFSSDYLMMVPHAGDWHRTADAYREEYAGAFAGDYVDWEETSPLAKETDLVFHYLAADRNNKTVNSFAAIAQDVENKIKLYGILPENVMVWIAGQGRHGHDNGNPDFFEMNEGAGGLSGIVKMMRRLQAAGVKAIQFYAHPYISDPELAENHVPEADTGLPFNWAGRKIGQLVCPYNRPWLKMWRERIVARLNEIGGTGIQIDQSPQQFAVCGRGGHLHGQDSLERLSANSKGIQAIVKVIRENAAREDVFIMSESAHDIQTRNMDIWQNRSGAEQPSQIARYTFPYRLLLNVDCSTAEGLMDAFAMGEIIVGQISLGTLRSPDITPFTDIIRETARIRRELREKRAPGFPYGFADRSGLEMSSSSLGGYVYRDDTGITVLYYAKEPVNGGLITVDGTALGFPDLRVDIAVDMNGDTMNYRIISVGE